MGKAHSTFSFGSLFRVICDQSALHTHPLHKKHTLTQAYTLTHRSIERKGREKGRDIKLKSIFHWVWTIYDEATLSLFSYFSGFFKKKSRNTLRKN